MNIKELVSTAIDAYFAVGQNEYRVLANVELKEATYKIVKTNQNGETFVCVVNPWGDGWKLHGDNSINDIPLYAFGKLIEQKTYSDDALRSFVESIIEHGEQFQYHDPKRTKQT